MEERMRDPAGRLSHRACWKWDSRLVCHDENSFLHQVYHTSYMCSLGFIPSKHHTCGQKTCKQTTSLNIDMYSCMLEWMKFLVLSYWTYSMHTPHGLTRHHKSIQVINHPNQTKENQLEQFPFYCLRKIINHWEKHLLYNNESKYIITNEMVHLAFFSGFWDKVN